MSVDFVTPYIPCRFCGAPLRDTFVDLGPSPLCESFVAPEDVDRMEPFYPLHVRICRSCLLVQLPAFVDRGEIFREYAYFSSYSDSWVELARIYAEAMISRLGLGPTSSVVELASNDGYLLQHFIARGIPSLGVEPARNVAAAAEARGVPTLTEFFGRDLAETLLRERGPADLVIGNNVLAQVPDLNDFVAGIAILLGPSGTATLEFPHVVRLVEGVQFDTIYHEHFSYFSLTTVTRIAAAHGLAVADVEELATHGGSLRVFLGRDRVVAPAPAVAALLDAERAGGYGDVAGYVGFEERVREVKRALLTFLIEERRAGQSIAGYGAPGKGNTLLNYCGIRTDLLDYTVDRNPYKHGRFTPGTRIPIHDPSRLAETRPDVILILPWNLRDEIARQLAYTREWGARLVVPLPRLEVL
jgi:C-methyltransferase C-terminal domain/Putative zinc binding domain/Methyltransferase domain